MVLVSRGVHCCHQWITFPKRACLEIFEFKRLAREGELKTSSSGQGEYQKVFARHAAALPACRCGLCPGPRDLAGVEPVWPEDRGGGPPRRPGPDPPESYSHSHPPTPTPTTTPTYTPHTPIHPQTPADTHSHPHTHAYIHSYIHSYTHSYTHSYIYTYTHAYVHTSIATYTYTHAYARTYTHTCMHASFHNMHACLPACLPSCMPAHRDNRRHGVRRRVRRAPAQPTDAPAACGGTSVGRRLRLRRCDPGEFRGGRGAGLAPSARSLRSLRSVVSFALLALRAVPCALRRSASVPSLAWAGGTPVAVGRPPSVSKRAGVAGEPPWSRMLPPLLAMPSAPSNMYAETRRSPRET